MKLSDRAMLVNLHVRVWHAEREDPKRAKEISDKYGSDARMGKYRRYLIDPDALKPILKERGAMRNRHYELTLPWGDDSARIITSAGYFKYRDEMRQFTERLEPMFRYFEENYPNLIKDAARLLNGLYDPSEYPSPNRIRSYFGVKCTVNKVPDSADFRVNLGADEISTIRKQIEADASDAVAECMRATVGKMRDAVSTLADRLKAYSGGGVGSGFKGVIIDNLGDLIDTLPGLNIAGDTTLDSIIKQMKTELTRYGAEELKADETARKVTMQKADDILAKLNDYGL